MAEKATYTLGIDIGGTKIFAAVIDKNGKILGVGRKATKADKGADAVVKRILKTMDEAVEAAKVEPSQITAIGAGVPGMVDDQTGVVTGAVNLPGWSGLALGQHLSAWNGNNVPVALLNDVKAACYGELVIGAGRNVKHFVTLFVGTGIGGGIVIDGKVYLGARQSAGEIGHMVQMVDGPSSQSSSVIRGGIETLASRTAIVRDIQSAISHGRKSIIPKLIEEKGEITSGILAAAMKKKDHLTMEIVDRAAYQLGVHAATLINCLDPELLIWGGGVIEALGEWMMPRIQEVAMQHCVFKKDADKIKFVRSELGDYAGVIGSAMKAREKLIVND